MSRRDLLAECNTDKEAIPAFQDGWCRRCINPECTRSLFGQSRFDLRVNSWEDRLFKNPPRLDTSDPRFQVITSKKFLSIDTSAPPEVRSWVDPMAAEPAPKAQPEPQPEPKADPPKLEETKAEPVPMPPAVSLPPKKEEPSKPEPLPAPKKESLVEPKVLSMNSLSQGGKVLPGVNKPQPTRDPWAVPEPAENIIPVGGRVKFRGSGV